MPERDFLPIPAEFLPPYVVSASETQIAPFVLCSPHSGSIYPPSFVETSRLSPLSLRKSEDCFVDDLFAPIAAAGVPLIAARFPRAFLDVNREPYELDPELFHEPLPDFANTQSVRVAGGLGTIARIVADGEEIYRQQAAAGLGPRPRRAALHSVPRRAVRPDRDDAHAASAIAILIDCHSMPSASMAPAGGPRPDIVLGDRFGASADCKITRFLKDALCALGYEVHMNRPYAGGYITEHYGRPGARGARRADRNQSRPLPRRANAAPDGGLRRVAEGPAKAWRRHSSTTCPRCSSVVPPPNRRSAPMPSVAKLCRMFMLHRTINAPQPVLSRR